MIEFEPTDWKARLEVSAAEHQRKKDQKRGERQQFALRRQAGLSARHAHKLARLKIERRQREDPDWGESPP